MNKVFKRLLTIAVNTYTYDKQQRKTRRGLPCPCRYLEQYSSVYGEIVSKLLFKDSTALHGHVYS